MDRYPLDKIILPMNACTVKGEKLESLWDNPDYVVETKFDGVRMLSIGGRFFSRRLSDVDGFPVEKTDRVPHLVRVLKKFPRLILDGEIWFKSNSSDVVSIIGSLPERAVELQQERGWLFYIVFDILRDSKGNWLLELPWQKRRSILESEFESFCDSYISLSNVEFKNKKDYYINILKSGGEGVMLKNINGKYILDKRPMWNWIKVKKVITDDVVIIGFDPPTKIYTGKELDTWSYWEQEENNVVPVTKFYAKGWVGAIRFGKYKNGKLIELGSCSGMTEEDREMFSKNKEKYIGKVIEITAMEKTKDGHYRHPQFVRLRPDKSSNQCVVGSD